jgi:hypothetical protein
VKDIQSEDTQSKDIQSEDTKSKDIQSKDIQSKDTQSKAESLIRIQWSFNFPKIIIAVVQLVYALISLYHARIHQIAVYGYAAFAMTVIPYAVMSFVNLISLLFCPDFPDLYLVDSSILKEAQDRASTQEKRRLKKAMVLLVGTLEEEELVPDTSQIDFSRSAVVDITYDDNRSPKLCISNIVTGASPGTIEHITTVPVKIADDDASRQENCGTLYIPSSKPPRRYRHPIRRLLCSSDEIEETRPKLRAPRHTFRWGIQDAINGFFLLAFYGVTLAIVGGISGFKSGQSTLAQKVWVMLWLVASLSWVLIDLVGDYVKTKVLVSERKRTIVGLFFAFIALMFMAPTVGGFVVVGQMLRDYGTCTILS